MSRKTSDVFRAGDITVDGTLNANESQLIFRALQKPYNPYSGQYYSLSAAQSDDPTLRINQYAANGTKLSFGYLYDTQFNPVPPGYRITVAGGVGDPTQEPNPSLIYSYDNIHWYPSANETNLFNGGGCTALAYNGFIFGAGGSGTATNKILYSANGTNWIASSSGTALCAAGCNNIATNGGYWIAGTSGAHRLITSYDGINWYPSVATNGGGDYYLTTSCNAAAWSGSLWLAGGQGLSNIIRSTDGFFWLPSNNANTIFQQCLTLAWNGTFWLAGGIAVTAGQPTIAISYDGITWAAVPVTAPTVGTPIYSLTTSCNTLAWSGAMWVGGGQDVSGNSLAYSYDGTAWFPGTNAVFEICYSVSWNGNNWGAAGIGANSLATSYSGVIWTGSESGNFLLTQGGAVAGNRVLPNAAMVQQINVVASSAAISLIGGSGETVIGYSKDGITWTPSTSAAASFPNAACLALGWDGFLWTAGFTQITFNSTTYTMGNSADGLTWGRNASGSSLLNSYCNAIANNQSVWIAGGAGDHRLAYSYDGISWAATGNGDTIFDVSTNGGIPASVNALAWNGSLWVAGSDCSTNRVAYSADGSNNWTRSVTGNAIFTSSCNGIAWNGLLWVAVGQAGGNSAVAVSYVGQEDWLRPTDTLTFATTWNTVAANETMFVIGGVVPNGYEPIYYSYDGMRWNPAVGSDLLLTGGCKSIAWNGTVWIAVGTGADNVLYSYNGATWVNSYNGNSIFSTGAETVATNRPQATTGSTRPVPTLYPSSYRDGIYAVTDTPHKSTNPDTYERLNSLYPSGIMFIDEASGNVGINVIPTQHVNAAGSNIDPTLDISGTGIYVQAGSGIEPSISLMNNKSAVPRIGRIQMLDKTSNVGWSIDDTYSTNSALTNHLKFVSWKNNIPLTVVDIAPGSSSVGGAVQINGTDPDPNGTALFVNGSTNIDSNAFSVIGNSKMVDGSLQINGLDPSGLIGGSSVFINGNGRIGSNALTVTGNTRLEDLYVDRINPTTFTPGTTATRYDTYATASSGTAYLPTAIAGVPGTYTMGIQIIAGGSGGRVGGGGGGGAYAGITVTGVAPGAAYSYVCGAGGAINTAGGLSSISVPSKSISYGVSGGRADGSGGTAPALDTYVVLRGNGLPGTSIAGGDGGLATAPALGRGGNPSVAGSAGFVSVDLTFVADPLNITNDLSGNTIIGGARGLTVVQNFISGGVGVLTNAPQLILGVPQSLNTGQFVFYNGQNLGPQGGEMQLGQVTYSWSNIYVNQVVGNGLLRLSANPSTSNFTLFPSQVNLNTSMIPVPRNAINLGTSDYHFSNIYVNDINPDGSDVSIGGDAGMTVSHVFGRAVLSANLNEIGLYGSSGGSLSAVWNGGSFYPSTANQGSLGYSGGSWSNIFVNQINPTIRSPDPITILNSSTPGAGSFILDPQYTSYTIEFVIVGGGGGGGYDVDGGNVLVKTAGGGSGALIQSTYTNVTGTISWRIGAKGDYTYNSGSEVATGNAGNVSFITMNGLTWNAFGGGGGVVTSFPIPIPGAGGTYSIPSGSGGVNGNSGKWAYATAAPGGASRLNGTTYGAGGDLLSGNPGVLGGYDGYISIIAYPSPTAINNYLSNTTLIDNAWITNSAKYDFTQTTVMFQALSEGQRGQGTFTVVNPTLAGLYTYMVYPAAIAPANDQLTLDACISCMVYWDGSKFTLGGASPTQVAGTDGFCAAAFKVVASTNNATLIFQIIKSQNIWIGIKCIKLFGSFSFL